jgi:hypothetical protein
LDNGWIPAIFRFTVLQERAMRIVVTFVLLVFVVGAAFADPAITIDQVPPWDTGSYSGYISGRVTGVVDPTQFVVAPVSYVNGYGWTSKPYSAAPYVDINDDGTWQALITTGGIDPTATGFVANLYAKTDTIPVVGAAVTPPISALASTYVPRLNGTHISWSGFEWQVKTTIVGAGFSGTVGPGYNRFTDSPNYVWVDGGGLLHMNLHQNNGDIHSATYSDGAYSPAGDGKFYAGEITSLKRDFGYGRYVVDIVTPPDSLPSNVVMGSLFTWSVLGLGTANINKEIDVAEMGRWDNPSDVKNFQDVLQPYGHAGNIHRITAPNQELVAEMHWLPEGITFYLKSTDGTMIDSWKYVGTDNPVPGEVQLAINGWFSTTPLDSQAPTELVWRSVSYTLQGDADLNGAVNGADLNIVLSNYNLTGMDWAQGDFNGDGTVNGADLNVVLSNYNQHVSLGAAVPEPGTLGMLALGAVGVLAWKGWRKRQ